MTQIDSSDTPPPAGFPHLWKVATVQGEWWPTFRDRQCVYVGFNTKSHDLSLLDRDAIESLLIKENGGTGLSSVNAFVHVMDIGDCVVANRGRSDVLGIGIIVSGYIPPNAPDNPSPDAQSRQSRRVRWVIDQPVDLDEQIFAVATVTALKLDQWTKIRNAYERKYPQNAAIKAALSEIEISLKLTKQTPRMKSRRYFLEITTDSGADRKGVPGHTLWTYPGKNGRRVAAREIIKELQPNDVVFILQEKLVGVALVEAPFRTIESTNIDHEAWEVKLHQFEKLTTELSRELLLRSPSAMQAMRSALADKNADEPLFFNRDLEIQQGRYLTEIPSEILQAWDSIYQSETGGKHLPHYVPPSSDSVPSAKATSIVQKLLNLSDRTRNLLLYGPPGTGKTFAVAQFRQHFLAPQLWSDTGKSSRLMDFFDELSWWEITWLTMHRAKQGEFSVSEIMNFPLMADFIARRPNQNSIRPTLWRTLNSHTSRESKTVKLDPENRLEPFLFEKTADSKWYLTENGKDFAQSEGKELLDRLAAAEDSNSTVDDFSKFLTFHQSLAYEEFVEGLKPEADASGKLSYDIKSGNFRKLCADAEAAWRNAGSPTHGTGAPKFLLIIDEINRANIAKVLGELITLIEDDKRLGEPNELTVTLPYSQTKFGVPPNLYILGTLNTADRSIAQLDLALRRRFTFVEMMPDPACVRETLDTLPLRRIFMELNKRIAAHLDRNHQIGHSYFMNIQNEADLRFAFAYKILPLLQEYFYDNHETLRSVLGDAFFEKLDGTQGDETKWALKDVEAMDIRAALAASFASA